MLRPLLVAPEQGQDEKDDKLLSTCQLVVNVLGLLVAVVHVHQLLTNVVLHPGSSRLVKIPFHVASCQG